MVERQAMRRLSPLPTELLRDGFCVRLRVTGRSMTPYLVNDDLATLEPVDSASIRLGDLVYVNQPGLTALLHRVVGKARGSDGSWTILTKGDALARRDPPVPADFVVGRVVAIGRSLPSGTSREVRLQSRHQRILQLSLALGSRHAPRFFASVSHRLVPRIHCLTEWVRRRL